VRDSGNSHEQGASKNHRPPRSKSASGDPSPKGGKPNRTLRDRFVDAARFVSDVVGSAWAFAIAIGIVVIWAVSGPMFHFSDTWQLVINTGTTIVTFLMVFLIQSTQNRDAKAVHLKLDELIRAAKGARNSLVDLEHLSEKELEDLATEFSTLSKRACAEVERRSHASHTNRTSPG
jgi:low affinity Fe/Cu permease